jgi:anti-sigma factor RsiW
MDDATLHAYVDGRLTDEQAAQVLDGLAREPHLALKVLSWQAQREQLRALHADVLDETVPAALQAALRPPAPRWPQAVAAMALLGVGVLIGMAWQAQRQGAGGQAPSAAAPAFVRDAAVAHAVYTPERRHPVEVGADEQAHLVQWLSKRLGQALRVPDLTPQGYALVGGRLLPGSGGAPPGPAGGQPTNVRAQFMYQNSAGERLTLYVSVFAQGVTAPTAFQLVSNGASRSFYWLDGQEGYALTGDLPAEALAVLARHVYEQIKG